MYVLFYVHVDFDNYNGQFYRVVMYARNEI